MGVSAKDQSVFGDTIRTIGAPFEVKVHPQDGSATFSLRLSDIGGRPAKRLPVTRVELANGETALLMMVNPLPTRKRAVEASSTSKKTDDVEAAFLRLKLDQFTSAKARMSEPTDHAGWLVVARSQTAKLRGAVRRARKIRTER